MTQLYKTHLISPINLLQTIVNISHRFFSQQPNSQIFSKYWHWFKVDRLTWWDSLYQRIENSTTSDGVVITRADTVLSNNFQITCSMSEHSVESEFTLELLVFSVT